MAERPRVIREYRETDLLPVKSLIHRAIAVCYPGYYCREAVRFFMNYHTEQTIVKDARDGTIIILAQAERIIGIGTLGGDEIKRIFVEPVLQRRGSGRLIMECLEEKAAAAGVATVRLHASLPSKAFYDKLGYVTVEKAFLPLENDQRLDFFKMQRSLL